jgi:lipoprotein NlpD
MKVLASARCAPPVVPAPLLAGLFLLVTLAGCASSSHRAPVEERKPVIARPATASGSAGPAPGTPAPVAGDAAAGKAPPGIENAGKPGYYSVRPGDTLIRIALDNGQNWRDVARWNGLDNPNLIEVGQVLRVSPPGADPATATARAIVAAGTVESRPLESKAGSTPLPAAPRPAASGPAAASAPASTAASATAAASAPVRDAEEEPNWMWPAAGPVATPFDDNRNKGLSISGKPGDPVLAAADGRVVYAGSGLRGYGKLVIVKHNATYLSAYAHNQALLVKEDDVVRRGQKIAEMGSSDAESVQLHFEIRRQGKPVDPARLLPPR